VLVHFELPVLDRLRTLDGLDAETVDLLILKATQ